MTEREDIDYILELYHKSLHGGHFGEKKMITTLSKMFHWKNMSEDIKEYIRKCPICEKVKVTKNTRVPMQISSLGEVLFDHTFIDFIGPIQPSTKNNKYIFSCVCDLTKMLVCVATPDFTAANCLLEHITCRYNFPSRIISDNATSFTSKIIKELTRLFSIKKIFTTAYHAQANCCERSNRSVSAFIRSYTTKNKDNWDDLLKFATFAYNNTVHTTTNYTPHFLAHGFNIQIPNHLTKKKLNYDYDNLASTTRNNIAEAIELAKQYLLNRKLHVSCGDFGY